MIIIGIDEAGRGACIGPLVVAAAKLNDKIIHKITNLGIKDSKKLLPNTRQLLYEKIINIILDYKIEEITAEEINAAVSLTILQINRINRLCNELIPYDLVIIDKLGGLSEANFLKQTALQKNKLIYKERADTEFVAVQAASILAKVSRDSAIKALGYNVSGYPERVTNNFIKHFLSENKTLPKAVRMKWKNIKKMIK